MVQKMSVRETNLSTHPVLARCQLQRRGRIRGYRLCVCVCTALWCSEEVCSQLPLPENTEGSDPARAVTPPPSGVICIVALMSPT